jgi:F0F1-type ATP synthase membrane subunit a
MPGNGNLRQGIGPPAGQAKVHIPPEADNDPEDEFWQRQLQNRIVTALSDVRSAADKWVTTISALTGVFAIAAIIKGPSDFTKLGGVAEWAVAILLGLATILAFVAIYLAALAAQGVPQEVSTGTEGFYGIYRRWVNEAAGRLKWSRIITVVVAVLIAIAIATTWVGTPQAGAPSYLMIQKAGTVACGTLGKDSAGTLTINNVKAVDIQSIKPINSCP